MENVVAVHNDVQSEIPKLSETSIDELQAEYKTHSSDKSKDKRKREGNTSKNIGIIAAKILLPVGTP